MRIAILALSLVAISLASPDAEAHRRGGARVHLFVGGPWYYPWYWGPPVYYHYSPAPVVVHREERVYVEKDEIEPAPAENPAAWWYFCEESKTYYPYVKSCPAGWKKVRPNTPPPQ